MSELEPLQASLGYQFQTPALLRLALIHPSVAQEQGVRTQNNQRLEFLGDSVLSLVLTETLYRRFPDWTEGQLTQARARLVNRRFLAERARRLDLGTYLITSRGEAASGGQNRNSNLADAFEAVLGAVYLDGGLDAVRAFVLRHFEPELSSAASDDSADNPKGRLQELLQATSVTPPTYRLIAATGPDHDRQYLCAVTHEGMELGRGQGTSLKQAETAAAAAALQKLKGGPPEHTGNTA